METALYKAGIKKTDWGELDVAGKDLETVFQAIANNGIVIAAHVDGPKGFLTALDPGVAKIKSSKKPNLSVFDF